MSNTEAGGAWRGCELIPVCLMLRDASPHFADPTVLTYSASLRRGSSAQPLNSAARYCLYEEAGELTRNSFVLENGYMLLVLLIGAILHAAIYVSASNPKSSFLCLLL